MEPLKTSETLIEGLIASKQDGTEIVVEGMFSGVSQSFDFGKEKCVVSDLAPVAESACIDPCNAKGFDPVDPSTHGDVSFKGISLFVELTGGVTNNLNRESTNDINNGRVNVTVNHQEYMVNVGDLVWAIIKNQSWWPGIACDASTAPTEAANGSQREDSILVRCFGNGKYVWCLPYEVKPFVGYFEQLPTQSKAKRFLDAFEIAVTELGHRVKTEFTCSCVSKMKVQKTGEIGDLSASQFEPAKFLDYIKDLAIDISMPNKIDYVVHQNCLSAFYTSLGHSQIPMHQLKPENGTPVKMKTEEGHGVFSEEDIGRSEKACVTRERRKSRFLTYPYENNNGVRKGSPVSGEVGIQESKVDINMTETNVQPVKKPRKKWSRRNKGVEANVCSSEVLSKLQYAAQDCVFPSENKDFDSVERFITGFRKWGFNNFTTEFTTNEMQTPQILQETGMERPVNMVGKDTLRKRGRKKKDKSVTSPTSGNVSNPGSLIIDFQNVGPFNLEAQPMIDRSTEVLANQSTVFGDLPVVTQLRPCKLEPKRKKENGDLPVVTQLRPCKLEPKRKKENAKNVTSPRPCKLEPKRKKENAENVASMPAWNDNIGALPKEFGSTPPYFTGESMNAHMEGLNQPTVIHPTYEFGSTLPCFTGKYSEPQLALVPATSSHEPKKRGRKRKNVSLQVSSGSTMMIPISKENGPEKKIAKRVKRSKEIGVPCIDLRYNKVQQDNGEVTGTAFLLKFSPDHPLPSNQDLNSVFLKYGALVESETQVLNENLSGQVVFLDSSSAGEAFWGLQNDQPFGPALVNYRIQHLAAAESVVNFKTPIKSPSGPKPIDSQAIIGSTMPTIANLNRNLSDNKLVNRNKTTEEIQLPSMNNLSYSKVQQGNGEVTGTALLLKFSPYHPLPTIQDLNSVFCKYGELNELETFVSGQNLSGQVVFVNPATAGDAIQKLDKDQPFGQALLSYRVHHLYSVQSAIQVKSPTNIPLQMKPPQDLGVIKKNLEMMNSMLEKAGGSLSPEMRWKLESEIKGLMNKVSAMDGSSSSCL